MSYSASMVIDTGGPELTEVEYIQSFTCYGELTQEMVEWVKDTTGQEASKIIHSWIAEKVSPKALPLLQNLRNACERHPKAILRIE